ncbi:MAG: MurR/RpiR family transcriptional regulator [Halioglobus sp.]|nr:MurR/RpiR family transcriptional regulator [Halioglobus sp.]
MSKQPPGDYESLRAEVSARYDSLSKILQQIARFAWDHPTDMAMGTTSVIAKQAGVQPSALIRFAKAFNYSGFTEMQRPFQQHVAERSASYAERFRHAGGNSNAPGESSPDSLLQEYCSASIAALEQLQHGVDSASLQKATGLLEQADSIYIIGQRRSYPVAAYLSYSLNHVIPKAHLLHGIGGMLTEQCQTMRTKDVLLAISFSPYSEDTRMVVADARERNIPVIVISDSTLSTVASLANVCFEIREAELYSFRSLGASMCLAQTLTTSLVVRQGVPPKKAPKKKRKMK